MTLLLHRFAKVSSDITVAISSDGGDIEEGLHIVDAMNIAKSKGCRILTNVGVSDTECDRMMSHDVYLNAEEAISLGIIHSIETAII